MRVVLGVSGGIAAYKACSLLRLFTESGHDVTVVPTEAALKFVGVPTWAALSGKPVATDVWTGVDEVNHVRIGQQAELVIVAPATADVMARPCALAGSPSSHRHPVDSRGPTPARAACQSPRTCMPPRWPPCLLPIVPFAVYGCSSRQEARARRSTRSATSAIAHRASRA